MKLIRIIILVLALAALAFFGSNNLRESSLRKEFNAIVDSEVNNDEFESAINKLSALENRGSKELQEKVRITKALSLFRWAQSSELSDEKTLELVRQAFQLDPSLADQYKTNYPTLNIP